MLYSSVTLQVDLGPYKPSPPPPLVVKAPSMSEVEEVLKRDHGVDVVGWEVADDGKGVERGSRPAKQEIEWSGSALAAAKGKGWDTLWGREHTPGK